MNANDNNAAKYLEVDEVCDCLLEWALDDRILAASYCGWSPWI